MKYVGIKKMQLMSGYWMAAEILSAAPLHTPNSRRRSCCATSCWRWWRTNCPATQPGQILKQASRPKFAQQWAKRRAIWA